SMRSLSPPFPYTPDIAFHLDFSWAGTFGETKDGLPYIGPHKDFDHSYFVLGFGGNGITFSVTGMEMTSAWLKGKKHKLDQWFKLDRKSTRLNSSHVKISY